MPITPRGGITEGLLTRIRNWVSKELGGKSEEEAGERPADSHHEDEEPATTAPQIMYRIRKGGRTQTKLWMKYNSEWRYVHPLSFRARSRGMQPLFYAHCEKDGQTESFRIDRIQDIHNTDIRFESDFDVEIG